MSADPSEGREQARQAAQDMDWQQVVLNGGPPCFHLLRASHDKSIFCGRAARWQGHGDKDFHAYLSLEALLEATFEAGRRSLEQERWISVEERLPDFRVPVIVQGGVAELRIDGWWTYMECPMRCIQWKVTHWQPLPAPPVHKGDS